MSPEQERILSPQQIAQFHKNGYLLLPNFFSASPLLDQAHYLLDTYSLDDHPRTKFSTGTEGGKHVGDSYFLGSGDKLRFFFEEGAFGEDGEFAPGHTKSNTINKIGHALHELDPVFRPFTLQNPRLTSLARELGAHEDPAVLQSMVICKQPKIGGKVPIHNDSTFLYTEPPSAVGFWFALEDCTKKNGCLWFLPGSHKRTQIHSRFVRLPTGGTGFEKVPGLEDVQDEEWDEDKFVCEPCNAGTLVLIHGSVIHKSEHNHSDKSRFIYTFHMIENNATYDEKNWLQPTKEMPFSRLFARDEKDGGGED